MHAKEMLRRLNGAALGPTLLGVAAIMYGISCFLQRDFAIYWQPVPESLPFRQAFAFLSAGLLVLGGLGLLGGRTVRPAAILLMVLFALYDLCYAIALVQPPITAAPLMGLAEQTSVVVGAWAILLRMSPGGSRGPITARITFGVCSLIFGLAHFVERVGMANAVPEWMPGGQMFWVLATGVGHVAVGLGLIANRLAVPATRLGALMYVCFVLFGWLPEAFTHPTIWLRWAGAAISLCMAGGLWAVGDLLVAQKGMPDSIGLRSEIGGEALASR
jgi:uncharacterized membrane protein